MPLYIHDTSKYCPEVHRIRRIVELKAKGRQVIMRDSERKLSRIWAPTPEDAELIVHKYRQCIDRPHEVHIL